MVKTILGVLMSITLNQSQIYTINELINESLSLDHQTVTIEAEVIGEVLERGDMAWINVNDGTNAIGVYLTLEQTASLQYFGDYNHTGDTVLITGVFERSCIEHGGEMDIHATEIVITKIGETRIHVISPMKFVLFLMLFSSALMLLYFKRNLFIHKVNHIDVE